LADRAAYIKAIENTVIERDVMETKYEDGFDKGIKKGREEATRQSILRALQQGKLTPAEIADMVDVPLAEVLALHQNPA